MYITLKVNISVLHKALFRQRMLDIELVVQTDEPRLMVREQIRGTVSRLRVKMRGKVQSDEVMLFTFHFLSY